MFLKLVSKYSLFDLISEEHMVNVAVVGGVTNSRPSIGNNYKIYMT
jgi:hypothetical protein